MRGDLDCRHSLRGRRSNHRPFQLPWRRLVMAAYISPKNKIQKFPLFLFYFIIIIFFSIWFLLVIFSPSEKKTCGGVRTPLLWRWHKQTGDLHLMCAKSLYQRVPNDRFSTHAPKPSTQIRSQWMELEINIIRHRKYWLVRGRVIKKRENWR